MDGAHARLFFALAVMVYATATLHAALVWRRGFQRGDRWSYSLIALGFSLQTVALMLRGFSLERCPVTNLFEVIAFVTWAIAAAYLVAGLSAQLRMVSVLLAPALMSAGVCALHPSFDTETSDFDLEHAALSMHVALVLLAYTGFGLASVAAVLFLMRERPTTTERWRQLTERLPALDRLEAVLVRSLGLGLILLTAGLVASFGLMRERYGVLVRPDLKIAWSLLVWVLYLGLLVWRLQFRSTVRWVAWGAIGGFAFLILTFWGTNLLSPIHHP